MLIRVKTKDASNILTLITGKEVFVLEISGKLWNLFRCVSVFLHTKSKGRPRGWRLARRRRHRETIFDTTNYEKIFLNFLKVRGFDFYFAICNSIFF